MSPGGSTTAPAARRAARGAPLARRLLSCSLLLGARTAREMGARAQDMAKMDNHMEPDGPIESGGSFYRAASLMGGGTDSLGYASANERSKAMTLHTHLAPLDCCESQAGSDIWGYTSPAGREYALMTYKTGLAVVDVTDPDAAWVVGRASSPSSSWKDVKVYGPHAYLVTEASRAAGAPALLIVDLTRVDEGVIPEPVKYFADSTNPAETGESRTHNVVIDEGSGFLYRVGGGNGMRVYDVKGSYATAPRFLGRLGAGYIHDAEVITFTSGAYKGSEIAFACSAYGSNHGLQIWNVTDKTNTGVLLSYSTWTPVGYSHNVWLDPATNIAYVGDEGDEFHGHVSHTTTHAFDVSNLREPRYLGHFNNEKKAIGHNFIIRKNFIFQANYASGVRVFDLSPAAEGRVNDIEEVAFFDTYTPNDSNGWNGAWGVYVFSGSGLVVVSDVNGGLFVVSLDLWPSTSPALVEFKVAVSSVKAGSMT